MTSADSLKEMEEKERKKREEMEEKERRKREREEKKKQREEEQKRKAAERAKRVEEKAKKAEEKVKKAKERAQKAAGVKRPPKRKPAGESSAASHSKKSRVDNSDGEIDPNICCTCFVHYNEDEAGGDWVSCVCGRWLHEDCVVDVTIDEEGKERLCPYCLNLFTL